MRIRGLSLVCRVASWGVFTLAIGWPAVALVGVCIAQGQPPEGGFGFSSRQLGLLGRSVGLSVTATVVCLLASLPGAFLIGRIRRLSHRPWTAAMLMVVILSPPMVCAFGWERIAPSFLDGSLKCVMVWALWAWPIPALLAGAGWSRVGRSAHEAALLSLSPFAAFVRVTVPVLSHYIALSALLVFALCFSDYSVPHACAISLFSTELLGWARASGHSIDTAWPSVLAVGVITVALIGIFASSARCGQEPGTARRDAVPLRARRSPGVAVIGCFLVSWLLPVGALVVAYATPAAMTEALRTYVSDIVWTVGLATVSGVATVGMGVGLALCKRCRTPALIGAVAFGALPGALVGEALIAAYNHDATWWLYDDWPIVVIGYVARFGWIGVLTGLFVARSGASDVVAQARSDGADEDSILRYVQLAAGWPTLLGAVGVVAAQAVAEVATTSLVRVPRFSPLALVLIEKFHRFEYGMLVSLSLWLVGAAVPPAILLALVMKRPRGT